MEKLKLFVSVHKNKIIASFVVIIILVLLGINSFNLLYINRVFPGVKVAGQNFGGLKKEQVLVKINNINVSTSVNLVWQNQNYSLNTNDFDLKYDSNKTAISVFKYGREGKPLKQFGEQLFALDKGVNLPLYYEINEPGLDTILATISAQISVPVVEPSATIENNQINVNPGNNGQQVEMDSLKNQIKDSLASNTNLTIVIPVKKLTPKLSDSEVSDLQNRSKKLIGKALAVTFEYQVFNYKDSEIVNLIEPLNQTSQTNGRYPGVNEQKIDELSTNIAKSVEREPQNAKFVFEEGKVKEFTPGKDGIRIKNQEFIQKISEAIKKLENEQDKKVTVSVPYDTTSPDVATSDVNTIGIKELIGHGESFFKGSIPSRVHNLSLATKHLNGIIIKPGEEFSFNRALGEVNQATGYERAFVIKQGKTVLDDGGGVCQVSTTFFRAALNSGLPILERHPHSYRVSYYEQGTKPGIDATIYLPGVDLKIKNDTGNNILIQSNVDLAKSKLTFDFYGTSDGRVSEVGNFRLWDITPPPPALYTDDPTLAPGQIKQTEHAIPGAKASFEYKVTRNGESLQNRTFYTNYQAWQAVYLLGPGAVAPQTQ